MTHLQLTMRGTYAGGQAARVAPIVGREGSQPCGELAAAIAARP